MELLDMMLRRRSVRHYIPGEIPEEALTKILQAGLLSASGRAIRPWELIVIRKYLLLFFSKLGIYFTNESSVNLDLACVGV